MYLSLEISVRELSNDHGFGQKLIREKKVSSQLVFKKFVIMFLKVLSCFLSFLFRY